MRSPYGAPRAFDDLAEHRLLVYGDDAPASIASVNWLLKKAHGRGGEGLRVLQINNIYGVLRAAESGLGVAALPDYLARDNPGLVQVMPEVEGPSFDTYFVYPAELRDSKRIALFRDFLVRQVAEWNF